MKSPSRRSLLTSTVHPSHRNAVFKDSSGRLMIFKNSKLTLMKKGILSDTRRGTTKVEPRLSPLSENMSFEFENLDEFQSVQFCIFFNAPDPNDERARFIPQHYARNPRVLYFNSSADVIYRFCVTRKKYVAFMKFEGTIDPKAVSPDFTVVENDLPFETDNKHFKSEETSPPFIFFAGKNPNQEMAFFPDWRRENGVVRTNADFVGNDASIWKIDIDKFKTKNVINFVRIKLPETSEMQIQTFITSILEILLDSLLCASNELYIPLVVVANADTPNHPNAIFFPPERRDDVMSKYFASQSGKTFIYDGVDYTEVRND